MWSWITNDLREHTVDAFMQIGRRITFTNKSNPLRLQMSGVNDDCYVHYNNRTPQLLWRHSCLLLLQWGWCRSCARQLTLLYERRKSQRGPSGRRCPPWWSRSAISGSTWQRWGTSTRHTFLTPPSPRRGFSATPSRALPSSSQQYSCRPRRSSTSCPGVTHHPLLPPGSGLSLPVAVGALLRPPELLRPRLNRHLGRRIEPLAGERRPPRSSQALSHPGSQRSRPDAGNPEMLEFSLS